MTTSTEILQTLRSAFGAEASVRARRPDLYQLALPIFMADGDGAQVFVRPRADGRVLVTDLGQTMTRLLYTRRDEEGTRSALGHLADRHGFRFVQDELSADVPSGEILAAALGLAQIESEAEASIRTLAKSRMKAERFRALVLDVLLSAFKEKLEEHYHAPDDETGEYSVDAKITSGHATLFVAITPSDLEAERAISSRLYLGEAKRRAARPKGPERWVAVPRDVEELQRRTVTRLMSHYMVPVPKYDELGSQLVPRLEELAA